MECCSTIPAKKPDAILDYQFNWQQYYLQPGEVIEGTPNIIVPSDLTLNPNGEAITVAFGVVTFWLGGGSPGANDLVTCEITTNQGRTAEASFVLPIRNRGC